MGCATGDEGKEELGTFGTSDKCVRFGPMKAAGAGLPDPLRIWVRFVMEVKKGRSPPFDIQFSKNPGRRTPTRIADGHADSHDEYGMSPSRCLRKLLKRWGERVVTVKIA
jgi:hypothetical protein